MHPLQRYICPSTGALPPLFWGTCPPLLFLPPLLFFFPPFFLGYQLFWTICPLSGLFAPPFALFAPRWGYLHSLLGGICLPPTPPDGAVELKRGNKGCTLGPAASPHCFLGPPVPPSKGLGALGGGVVLGGILGWLLWGWAPVGPWLRVRQQATEEHVSMLKNNVLGQQRRCWMRSAAAAPFWGENSSNWCIPACIDFSFQGETPHI